MHRRSFLHHSLRATAGSAALQATGRLWATTPAAPDARFLLVFLRGGYDALSLLVPQERQFYSDVRPAIAVPQASLLPLHPDWGLHPALLPSVWPLAQRGQAAFVPFAGTHDTSRSHFETQDNIELGADTTPGAARDFQSGFMNRLAQQLLPGGPTAVASGASALAIAFTEQLPLTFRGRLDVANASLKQLPRAGDNAALQAAIAQMYRHHPLGPKVDAAFEVRDQLAQDLGPEMAAASRGAISTKGFELEARRMARLMRDRYALGFVDVGGWDIHANQGAASGPLATRLDELGRGLAAFADEMGEPAWQRTVVVVLSEFGRTVRQNGSRATDHGHGSVYWVLGGGLAARGGAGAVAGEQQAVAHNTLFQNRDLPVLNDYRALLGGLLARQFGLSPAALAQVFPGATPRDLRLL